MSANAAIISIGTNSTRALLADMAPELPHVEVALSVGTRLGEGLGQSGAIGAEPMRRTLDAVRSHFEAMRGRYERLSCIATSAVRRATNGDNFAQHVAEITGVPLAVLSGEEEARASYRGAITALDRTDGKAVGVIDTGGGSTEYAVGRGTEPEHAVSCEIGAVRLTELVPGLSGREGSCSAASIEEARALANTALEPIAAFPAVGALAFVGGSAMTAAAIIQRADIPGGRAEVTRGELEQALAKLCAMDLEARKTLPGMKPQRADILPAGIIVLETILELTGRSKAVATTADLLLGYLLQQRDGRRAAAQ